MVKRLVSSGPADHVHTSAEVVNCFVVPGLFGNKGKLIFFRLKEMNKSVIRDFCTAGRTIVKAAVK